MIIKKANRFLFLLKNINKIKKIRS